MAKGLSVGLFLLLAACASVKPKAAGPLTILAVGDSFTALGGAESWPAHLERLLAKDCAGVKVKNWAVPGSDSAEAAARLPAGLSIHKPQAVIAMLGIGDEEGSTPKLYPDDQKDGDHFPFAKFQSEQEYEAKLLDWMKRKPWSDRRFVYLFARPYRDAGRVDEEIAIMRGILATRAWNPWALAELGTLLRMKGRWEDAEKLHQRAFESAPEENHLLQEWLADFRDQKGFEAAYREALTLTKNHRPVDFVAASFYQAHNLREKHEQIMRKIVREGCSNRKCLLMQQVALVRNGKMKEARAIKLPPYREPLEATKVKIAEVAADVRQADRAALFLMQYPLMPAEYLEKLDLLAAVRPVAIIPNEQNFRSALENQPYDALFADRSAGDFGLFLPPATRLVAESAAARVLPWAKARGYCE